MFAELIRAGLQALIESEAAELVTWIAQMCRRYAIEFRAIDEMHAATWRSEPAVPDNPSVFAFPRTAPPSPPRMQKLATIKAPSLDFVRESLQEAQDILNYSDSETARAAERIHRWCNGGWDVASD